jgi:hypothetical protein
MQRAFVCAFAAMVSCVAAGAGEVLYNGIALPDAWPPRRAKLTREPANIPYLKGPPKVIPIDVGRQLFVDDFLIADATGLKRTFHTARPHQGNPVVTYDKPWEREGRSPFASVFSDGVWYDPVDKLFKMWYLGGYLKTTCLATSKGGLRWTKPALDVEKGTNIVMRHYRDSSTVWLDHAESDPKRRYKMFTTMRKGSWRLALHCSPDGIHWSKALAVSPAIGDRTTVQYNPFRKVWVYGLRISAAGTGRARAYREHRDPVAGMTWTGKDTVLWVGADKLDPHHPKFPKTAPQLYNLDCAPYESLMIGLFSIHQGPSNRECSRLKIQKRNDILLGFSRDGFHFHRPDRRRFIGCSEIDGRWDWGNVQSAGGGCLVVGDKLYFFYSGRLRSAKFWDGRGSTGVAVLRRDGFASMDAGNQGALTTRPVRFKGRFLFVNADADGGEIRAEVLGADGKPVAPYTRANCVPVTADNTSQTVTWRGARDLKPLSGRTVRLRFSMTKARLFAFWVSPEASGASHGYVAAGGPGFTGPTDTVGAAATRKALSTPARKASP